MKKFELERSRTFDPDILKDLKLLYGPKNLKKHLKRIGKKKKAKKKGVNNNHLNGVLGLATFLREAEPPTCLAASHVIIARYIEKQLNK